MGSGSNLSIWEPQILKKMEHIFVVLFDVQSVKKDEKSFLAINSPSTIALNTMSYMCT